MREHRKHLNTIVMISKNILTLTSLLILFSCNRIKRKGDVAIEKTKHTLSAAKQKIRDKKNQLIDKVFPAYDLGEADTDNNKRRFKEHLQTDVTSDVKNIYTFGDFIGIDYKVLIAFTCDQSTVDKIIAANKMKLSTDKYDDGLSFPDEFPWWNKNKIELLQPYKVGKKGEFWQYLWYDAKTREAFYEEFSL